MESVGRVVARTEELAAIPAPTGHEQTRAALVGQWWQSAGLAQVHTDSVGNLWARVRDGEGPAVVLGAHLDTIFDADVDHTTRREGTRLYGPGVGDNTVAVAALAELDSLLPPRTRHPVWLLATVGEEGLGNLVGAIEAMRRPREHRIQPRQRAMVSAKPSAEAFELPGRMTLVRGRLMA